MHQRVDGWAYLRDHLPADVALLQEAAPREASGPIFRKGGIGTNRPWGSAIVPRGVRLRELTDVTGPHSVTPASLYRTWPGAVVVAVAEPDDQPPVTFVGVYGLIDCGYAVTTVHRVLSDLTPLLDSRLGKRLILGGDLNCSTQLKPPHRERHRDLFSRFAGLGLVDLLALPGDDRGRLDGCPCADSPCRHVQTHRHPRSEVPWQDDYLFATKAMADRLVRCEAIDHGDPDPWAFSDHCPIAAEFDR